MLPGVNGASATALKAVAQDIATSQACGQMACTCLYDVGLDPLSAQGFGKGEFSAWAAASLADDAASFFVCGNPTD